MNRTKPMPQDIKRVFWKKGACSSTFFYILNREFGHLKDTEERAAEPFAGGIMQKGHQCGMLWGSAMAVGAESYRRQKGNDDPGQAIAMAITATQHLMESFEKRTQSVNCKDVTGCDFSIKFEMAKFMLKSFLFIFFDSSCFKLAEKWAPEAILSATEGLAGEQTDLPKQSISCASEVAKKMGATEEEMLMVAGFAGGLGLSGNACGALSAAIWMNTLNWFKKQEKTPKDAYLNSKAKDTLNAFNDETGSEILCHKITGRRFETIDDHTEFIKNGGCEKLINVLAQS